MLPVPSFSFIHKAMKLVIRLSTVVRALAAAPQDFFTIPGLEKLGKCYLQRSFDTPEAFNEAFTKVSSPNFRHRGAKFFGYALTADDEANMVVPAAVKDAPEPIIEPVPVPVVEAPQVEVESDHHAIQIIKTATESNPEPSVVELRMDGKSIFIGEDRVASLCGDDSHLRVLAAYSSLRPAIEDWLKTQTPTQNHE